MRELDYLSSTDLSNNINNNKVFFIYNFKFNQKCVIIFFCFSLSFQIKRFRNDDDISTNAGLPIWQIDTIIEKLGNEQFRKQTTTLFLSQIFINEIIFFFQRLSHILPFIGLQHRHV